MQKAEKHKTLVNDEFLLVLLNATQEVSEKDFVVQPSILFQGLVNKANIRWGKLPDKWPQTVADMNTRVQDLTDKLKTEHRIQVATMIKDGALCWRFRKEGA